MSFKELINFLRFLKLEISYLVIEEFQVHDYNDKVSQFSV